MHSIVIRSEPVSPFLPIPELATNLAASEVHPKVMQKLLGHTSPIISLQVYTHVHEDQGAVAINAMNDLKESKRLADVAL